jgi:Ca2+-binding EF-hand superfamily protein
MSSIVVDKTQMEMLLEDVIETLDEDKDGEIDRTEFVEGSLKVSENSGSLC